MISSKMFTAVTDINNLVRYYRQTIPGINEPEAARLALIFKGCMALEPGQIEEYLKIYSTEYKSLERKYGRANLGE